MQLEDGGNSLLRAATANQLLEHTNNSYLLRNIRPRACVSVCVYGGGGGGGYAPLKARATDVIHPSVTRFHGDLIGWNHGDD